MPAAPYPPLPATILDRFREAGRLAWQRLAYEPRNRRRVVLAYLLAGSLAAYAMAHLLYELNLNVFSVFRLPFWTFYSEQLVPFVAAPFRWVGIDLHHILRPLLILSGLGAALWAGAEYRRKTYLILFPFPRAQRRPGDIDLGDWSTAPPVPSPPRMLSAGWFAKIPHTLLLKYTFLGLLAAIPGMLAGVRALCRYACEALLLLAGTGAYVVQHVLAPYERWDDQGHPATKRFLSVYRLRRDIDTRLHEMLTRPRFIPAAEIGTIKPLIETLLEDSGRVFAVAIGVLSLTVIAQRVG